MKIDSKIGRALNDMTTILSKDHTEKEFKWALLHVLRALAEEIVNPEPVVVNQEVSERSIKDIMARIREKMEVPGCRLGCQCYHCRDKRMEKQPSWEGGTG